MNELLHFYPNIGDGDGTGVGSPPEKETETDVFDDFLKVVEDNAAALIYNSTDEEKVALEEDVETVRQQTKAIKDGLAASITDPRVKEATDYAKFYCGDSALNSGSHESSRLAITGAASSLYSRLRLSGALNEETIRELDQLSDWFVRHAGSET